MNLKIGDKVAIRRSKHDISLGIITDMTRSLGKEEPLYIITWFDQWFDDTDYYHNTTNSFNYTFVWRQDYLELRRELGIDAHN